MKRTVKKFGDIHFNISQFLSGNKKSTKSRMKSEAKTDVAHKSLLNDKKTSCNSQKTFSACFKSTQRRQSVEATNFPPETAKNIKFADFPARERRLNGKIRLAGIDFLLNLVSGHPARSDEEELF